MSLVLQVMIRIKPENVAAFMAKVQATAAAARSEAERANAASGSWPTVDSLWINAPSTPPLNGLIHNRGRWIE